MAVCFKTREESQWSLTFEVRKSLTFQDVRRARAALQWSLTFEVRKRVYVGVEQAGSGFVAMEPDL